MNRRVVLVDENDNPLGEIDKLEAQTKGLLHRSFSIFIFNSGGEMLIHQRAAYKYRAAHLWANACCSHPRLDEDVLGRAEERLQYEMGLRCKLDKAFCYIHNSPVGDNLTEHKYTHVFIGYTDAHPDPNPLEVQQFYWMKTHPLRRFLREYPEMFTIGFKMICDRVINYVWTNK